MTHSVNLRVLDLRCNMFAGRVQSSTALTGCTHARRRCATVSTDTGGAADTFEAPLTAICWTTVRTWT
jgi:hypothetical protein